jgi:hypothetical protein
MIFSLEVNGYGKFESWENSPYTYGFTLNYLKQSLPNIEIHQYCPFHFIGITNLFELYSFKAKTMIENIYDLR